MAPCTRGPVSGSRAVRVRGRGRVHAAGRIRTPVPSAAHPVVAVQLAEAWRSPGPSRTTYDEPTNVPRRRRTSRRRRNRASQARNRRARRGTPAIDASRCRRRPRRRRRATTSPTIPVHDVRRPRRVVPARPGLRARAGGAAWCGGKVPRGSARFRRTASRCSWARRPSRWPPRRSPRRSAAPTASRADRSSVIVLASECPPTPPPAPARRGRAEPVADEQPDRGVRDRLRHAPRQQGRLGSDLGGSRYMPSWPILQSS